MWWVQVTKHLWAPTCRIKREFKPSRIIPFLSFLSHLKENKGVFCPSSWEKQVTLTNFEGCWYENKEAHLMATSARMLAPVLHLHEPIEKSLAIEIISYVSGQSDSNDLSDTQTKFSGWLLSTFLYSTNVILLDADITEVSSHNSAIVSGILCVKDQFLCWSKRPHCVQLYVLH